MKPRFLLLVVALVLLAGPTWAADALPSLDVWPAAAPGEKGDLAPEKATPSKPGEKQVTRISNVSHPTLTVYAPPAERNTGTAVVICPGGGYNILAIDLEGEEVARWLNSIGVTGVILKYRVPARKDQPRHLAPLQDAQRAVSLVRAKASQWGVAADRIGILGFSAGGHLSAAAATNFDTRQYPAVDPIDRVSCRPDFAVLVYPAYLDKDGALAPEIRVTPETPPVFFVHAGDDRIGPENSLRMFVALRQAKVPAELHVFPSGGHGFGLRPSEHPISGWPKLCEQWMRSRGLLNLQR